MLIYENNNKLNINFDNEVSENPDLEIGKEDGKTEVLIDGQPVSGGSGGVEPVIVTITPTSQTGGTLTGAAWEGLLTAYNHNVAGFRAVSAQGGDQRWMNYMVFADGDSRLAWMGFIGPTPVGYLFNPDGTFLIETFT